LAPGAGTPLRHLLFEHGVEFPCGGVSGCGGCRVRVLQGDVPVTPSMRACLSQSELSDGWRLGCQAESDGPVTLEVDQWSRPAPRYEHPLPLEPAAGLGAVVDVGTTTVVAQLVERATGRVLGVQSALNPQATYGSDVIGRVARALTDPGSLTRMIRDSVGSMLSRLARGSPVDEVVLVGNTAMHHLFCGLDVSPLAAVPFRPVEPGLQCLDPGELRWGPGIRGPVHFLPCIGGFVGSDLLAGIVATDLHDSAAVTALLDLGTNGDMAVGDRHGIVCASTAAGPAFEGGRIGHGMRADAGAIDRVWIRDGGPACSTVGGGAPRGICGSGVVDAVAVALDLSWLRPNGRIERRDGRIPLAESVWLSQADIRELQLAKGAVAAGLELLGAELRAPPRSILLAGAFGNYIKADSARRIGVLPLATDTTAVGNTALRGARMLLLAGARRQAILDTVLQRVSHRELGADPAFLDRFAGAMPFPSA
jgi:uncharacterized 2Fe-2S/4Fe-4S cluster protein (DUF4445 family)